MGSYGVAAAALNYFNKELSELTIEEAAYLAALPKAPNNYHPFRTSQGGDAPARLDHRSDGGGRLHHGRAGQGAPRPSRSRSISARSARRSTRPTTSPRTCGARWSTTSARMALRPRGARCRRRRPRQRRPLGQDHARSRPAAHGAQGADRRPRRLRSREGLARSGAEDRHRRRLGRGARPASRFPATWRPGASASCSRRRRTKAVRRSAPDAPARTARWSAEREAVEIPFEEMKWASARAAPRPRP